MKALARAAIVSATIALIPNAMAEKSVPRADECMAIAVIDSGLRAIAKLAETNPDLKKPDLAQWADQIAACKAMGAWLDLPDPKTKDEYAKALTLGMMVATGYTEGKRLQLEALQGRP